MEIMRALVIASVLLASLSITGCQLVVDFDRSRLDAGMDLGPAPTDMSVAIDAGTDAGVDAGTDAGVDAGTDAGVDAGTDAGIDAGTDAGLDAGV